MLRYGSNAVDVLAFTRTAERAYCEPPNDAMLNTGLVKNSMKGDCSIVQTLLDHGGRF
jgi:hypothetical protein